MNSENIPETESGIKKAMADYLFQNKKYRDLDGNFKSLYQMFQDEPQWAINRYKNLEELNKQMLNALKVARDDMTEYHQSIDYDDDECEPYRIVVAAIKAAEEE